jgi:hypothetical protein
MDITGTEVFNLTYFFDEHLGHYLWHIGVLGLAAIFLEGQTLALGLPFAFLVVLFTLVWGRKNLPRQPVLAFFFVACLLAALFFTAWGLYWGGFPQFSEVGLV